MQDDTGKNAKMSDFLLSVCLQIVKALSAQNKADWFKR
jgi:hypothetical protein